MMKLSAESSPYVIATEKQLGYFLKQLASGVTYDGKYIRLNKSLDMTGNIWDTSHNTAFGGVFDGQGYTITADCPFMTVIGATGVVQGLNYNTYHIQLGSISSEKPSEV